jgi:hypothetical protein
MTAMSLLSVIRCLLLASLVIAAACVRRADLSESAITGSALLSWSAPTANVNGSPLNGPTGYGIYYGPDPGQLNHRIEIRDPSVVNWTVSGLPAGTWYFTATTLGRDGTESEYSTMTSKEIR